MTCADPQEQAVVSIRGLRHVYRGGTVALERIDLDLGRGLFGLLGPNGAGKSTLMKILCTVLEPSEGKVSIAGKDVVRDRQAVRAMLGYLPQDFGAWRLHRVGEVVDTLAFLSGVSDRSKRRASVRAVLEQVGLSAVIDRKVKNLSGGMLRRLGVAQALVHEPRILVMDEPTVGLDPQERLRFRQLMSSLGRDRTIVLSTHIVADLGSGFDDLALIHQGRIVFRGSPTELVQQARGAVIEREVLPEEDQEAPSTFEVVSRTSDRGRTTNRAVVTDGTMPKGARPVADPTLEEAYLAFVAGRRHQETAAAVAAS
jgi:ABC-type multidrug transport system ATPase subunit